MSSNTEYLSKDVISNLQEMYEKTRRLIDEDSKNDPETDPYRSKYKAAGILNEMKSILTNNLDSIPADTVENFDQAKIKVVCMLGFVLLQLGIISYETEEMSTAEEQFSKCAALLTPYIKHPFCIITMMNTLNQLGILWSERGDTTKALDYLEKCENLYKDFTTLSRDTLPHPVSVSELFTEDASDAEAELEKTHTFTLYYLAQVYGVLKEHLRSAVYCHNTLKRQLESKNFESIDWALNAATLSQFFATHNGFAEARHHLAAASTILDQLEVTLQEHPEGSEQERDAKKETFRHRSADVARCWAKYGLNLLSVSQARLMRLSADDNAQQNTLENGGISLQDLAVQSNLDPELLKGLQFASLELSTYEGRVAATPANLFEEARQIFLDAKEWLTKAQEYYTMDHHASDAVEIVQDMSHLYQNLAFFEGNEERQSRMHKRRINLLEGALAQLNPAYYLSACRQMWFELGEIYSEMLEIKKQKLRNSGEPTAHALSKINTLAQNGIGHLNSFIKSVHDRETKSLPEELEENVMRPTLVAFFYLGKLYRELVSADKTAQFDNLVASIAAYKYVVDYCDKHEEAKQQMGSELGISREMLELLPIKARRLKAQITQQ